MSRPASGTVEFRGSPPRWFARITARTPEGQIVRPWVDLERPDLKNTPEDKAKAKALARKRSKQASKPGVTFVGRTAVIPSSLKLADLEERWFSFIDRDPDLAVRTVERYKQSWKVLVGAFGPLPLLAVTPLRIREWVWKRRAERSANTVINECITFSRFFEDAISEKWVPTTVNPMHDRIVRDAKPKAQHSAPEDIVRYTKEQAEALLAAPGMPDDFFGLLLTLFTTGARGGEGRGLQFKHLKDPRTDAPCVRIVQQVAKEGSEKGLHVAPPKRGSTRTNPLHSQLATWLEWWRAEGWARLVGREPTEDDFVFPAPDGIKCRPRDAETLQEWAVKAELPAAFARQDGTEGAFDMRGIRRTFASLLADLEVDGELLDELMGHKAKSVRGRHYQGTWFDRKVRAVERLRLTLPDRPGVAAVAIPSPPQSSRQLSQGRTTEQDSGRFDACEPYENTASLPDRKREADWRGPRSSKSV